MADAGYAARRNRLIRSLKSSEVECLLVTRESSIRYLTGFTGDSSWLLIGPTATVLISDSRYQTQIREECPELEACIRTARKSLTDTAAGVVCRVHLRHLGFESDYLTVAQHSALAGKLTSTNLVPTNGLVEVLRAVKDKWETAQIHEAIRQAERAIAVIRAGLRPDQTETQIRFLLESSMRDFGAAGAAFEPIVAVGPTAALPHAHAGRRRVSESSVLLIDWGAVSAAGYRSDLTRVFFTGRVTKKMKSVYDTVLAAQRAAIHSIRAGVVCRDVDAAARSVIEKAGYGRRFGHGLGHGIGLDIHEDVRLSPTSEEVLKPGMVVTVEPGIYLDDQFGVRVEDDVLVTRNGCEVLTSVPREFDDVVIDFLA